MRLAVQLLLFDRPSRSPVCDPVEDEETVAEQVAVVLTKVSLTVSVQILFALMRRVWRLFL